MAKRNSFAIKFATGGRRAAGLANRVGDVLKRNDQARKLAASSTGRKAKTIVSQAVRTTYNASAGLLNDRLRGQASSETISVYASLRKFYLSEFGGKWAGRTSPGATASILRGRTKTYKGAFIAAGRSGGGKTRLIYQRIGNKKIQTYGSHKGQFRQSIRALRGPSLFQMVVDPEVGDIKGTSLRVLSDYFVAEFRRQFRRTRSGR